MKKLLVLTISLFLCSVSQLFAVTVSDDSVSGVNRYAVYVGCNYGGKSRERLLYAGSDAQSFKVAMAEIGGVTDENSRILIDPSKENVDKALSEISQAISENTNNSKRSEFIFYYSGHSDENALLLGDAKYDYSKLKAAISAVPSDIHVVILDSCYSGNFIRTKGGQKRKPFLIDDSSVVTGHAYLSSSSDNESSQESDEIESSYFTNAMITGLRGAADASGDNKVTLNELYSYAFNDTLSKTESSKAGPQHPNFNITLVGSGDLVLSDLSTAEAMLSLSKDAKGRFIIRDANDKLISEINKVQGQPIFMALPSGQYSALIIDEYSTKQGTFILEKDQVYVLDQNSLSSIKRKSGRLRGDSEVKEVKKERTSTENEGEFLTLDDLEDSKENKNAPKAQLNNSADLDEFDLEPDEEDLGIEDLPIQKERTDFDEDIYSPFKLMFVPGVTFVTGDKEDTLFTIGLVGSKVQNNGAIQISTCFNLSSGNIFGVQYASIFNISTGENNGVQLAGLFNIGLDVAGAQISGFANIGKENNGLQLAGFSNISKEINGLQLAGFINIADKVNGAQIGIVNIANESDGMTLGLLNYVHNGLHDVCFSIDSDGYVDWFYQGGSKDFFTTFGYSQERFDNPDYGVCYFGIGSEASFEYTSFDFEFIWKMLYSDKIAKDLEYADKHNYSEDEIKDILTSISIPSFKVTWNFWESKHVRFFGAFSFDLNIFGWNDYAFDVYKRNWVIESEDFNICPAFNIGVKVKI